MTLLLLALASLIQVFAMAFQSKNINGGHYVLAASGSIFIGLSQAYVYRAITAANANIIEALVYSASGGAGCVFAMWTHRRFVKEKKHG